MLKWLFDRVRGTKIRTSLYVLFGLCVAIMGVQSGIMLLDAWKQVRSIAEITVAAVTNRDLFTALQYTRYERGPIRVLLDAPDPADPKLLMEFANWRAKAEPAFEKLLVACGEIRCADGDVVGNLRRGHEALAQMRTKVDAAMRQPKTARPAGITKQWYDTSSALTAEMERVSLALTERIRMADPEIAELVGIKEGAWIVRDAAGLERTVVQDVMSNKKLTPEARLKLTDLRGKADAGWRTVTILAARPGLPAPVLAAVKTAQKNLFDTYAKKRGEVEKAILEGREPPLTIQQLVDAATAALDDVVAVCTTALGQIIALADAQAAAARMRLAVNAGGLAFALIIGATGFLVAWRRIAHPIGEMSQVMLRMADGDLALEMPSQDRRDEIGDVARAAHIFHQSLVRMREMEAEKKEAELRSVAERHAAEEREAAQQRLAEEKAAAERKAAMHALASQFEATVGHIVGAVSSAATELEAAANTLTQTAESTQRLSGSVAAASEEASANVESVASATEEMSASIAEISRQVADSSNISGAAVKQAEKTDARISELSQAAGRIGDVVKLITAIAEQTNLLALNATIEAARAGEAGKGFAVVAQEVKALASQTAKATDEIGTQIAGMQAATKESVLAIKEIGATITKVSDISSAIASAMDQQGTATQDIARNVQEAAKGTAEVATNITEVNRGASETGSASTQMLASARALAGESNHLKQEVDKFLASVRAA